MAALDTCQKVWASMSVLEREIFLKELQEAVTRIDETGALWDEVPIEALALKNEVSDLPLVLCGHLLMAVTRDIFPKSRKGNYFSVEACIVTANRMRREAYVGRRFFDEIGELFHPLTPIQ